MKNQYLIVGSGRMARHFAEYCRLLRQPFLTWSRKQNVSDSDLQRQASVCSHILLLISDSAIADFVASHSFLREKVLVHFSGVLEIEGVMSAHPLMTFGSELYTFAEYQRIPFVLTGNIPLPELLPGFPNPSFQLQAKDKAYYHAWCVMSGNFTTLLWQNMRVRLEAMGLPAEIIQPYLEQTTENILTNPQGALTGPLARRDLMTVEKNLSALQERHDLFEKVYRAFKDVVLEE